MISFVLLISVNICLCVTSYPSVKIPQGILKGQFLKTDNNRTFSSFTGVPYGEPPIGSLRFELARPAKKWKDTLDATKSHPVCPQVNIFSEGSQVEGDEDCLYLNIYTPKLKLQNITRLLPVMIFIYGGAFLLGDANRDQVYNPNILLDKDVVLVTLNYRLGPLGFLSTGDEVVPGNNGLKDQNLAIKWVKENIKHFGGNPNCVTLWGQSAGSASAHFHMLSPLSKGLFHRVISQSGTALGYWALAPNDQGIRNARKLATSFNCSINSSREMVKCLKRVDPYEITKRQHDLYEWFMDPMIPFRPVVEPNITDAFLPESPATIIKSGKAAQVPFLTGITTQEGAFRSSVFFVKPYILNELNANFSKIAPLVFLYDEIASDVDYVTRKIKDFYFENKTITNSSRMQLTDAFTDSMFLTGANNALWLQVNYTNQPVYYYAFGYRGNYSLVSAVDNSFNYGVSHGDDLLYLFSPKVIFPEYEASATDKNVIDILTTLWVNFATFGNPTPSRQNLKKWNPVKSENLEYYVITNYTYMDDKLYWNRTQLWKSFPLM